MIDLSTKNVRKLFEQQIKMLTQQTLIQKEDSFDYQFSGRWIQ
jgi:hypothetical protein